MSNRLPKGKYIFTWGGVIANAGGMTRAMLKRTCTFLREGIDVKILLLARGTGQFDAIEHYRQNGYPEISAENFVLRDLWLGERLADLNQKHKVGHADEIDKLPYEEKDNKKIYWKNGYIYASEPLRTTKSEREITYVNEQGQPVIAETYWNGSLYKTTMKLQQADNKTIKVESFFASNGFCHTRFVSVLNKTWDVIETKIFNEKEKTVLTFKDNIMLGKYFFTQYVNECTDSDIFIFCDPFLDWEPGYAEMKEKANKRIYKIGINHGCGFGGDRNWNSQLNPRIRDNIEKRSVPTLDAFILLTKQAQKDFTKRLGDRNILFYIPNTISIPKQSDFSQERNLNSVVFVGRFDEKTKQITHLIHAFSKVVRTNADATLHLYGRGTDEDIYRKLIHELNMQNNIIIEGFSNDVNSIYQKSAFSVCCSDFEGFSLSLHESLANGCPVIAYDFKFGPRDTIRDGSNGFIVPKNDIDSLAAKIAWLLDNPEKIKEMSNCAYESVQKYHEKHYLENWIQILNKVVEQHPYRVSLEKMDIEPLEYLHIRHENLWEISIQISVYGNIPSIAYGMEHIYVKKFNSDGDFDVIEPVVTTEKLPMNTYKISFKIDSWKNRELKICFAWNNCYLEKSL